MSTLIGKTLLNRYRVDSFLGRGGMAEVYKVWDSHRNAWMAMKVLHEDLALDHTFLRRFKREAETLEHLQHPNIVRFYGLEQEGRIIFMLMDYVDGESLKHKIFDANGALPFNEIYEITTQLAWALKYAHAEGFVHSDVKPANIMLATNGQIKLSDFGIARMTDSATMTMIGAGTPAYMSPEQAQAHAPDPQMDIYALGIVLYEMLTGMRPFTGELATGSGTTNQKIRWEQVNLNAQPPSRLNQKIPLAVDNVVLKALAKDKSHRFQSIGSFLDELSRAFHSIRVTLPTLGESIKSVPSIKPQVAVSYVAPIMWLKKNNVLAFILIMLALAMLFLGIKLGSSPVEENSQSSLRIETSLVPHTQVLETISPTAVANTPQQEVVETVTPASISRIGSTIISEKDGMVSSYIPTGEFLMGNHADTALAECNRFSNGCQRAWFIDEEPVHSVYLDAYWTDQTEVTNAMYEKCVSANICLPPTEITSETRDYYYGNPRYDDYPVMHISWRDANTYCEWAGRQLPTEAEWEKAARGDLDGKQYPWGDLPPICQYDAENGAKFNDGSGCNLSDTERVGSYAPNGYGLYDMAGNLWEWVRDWHDDYYYGISPSENPLGPETGKYRVLRGGSWYGYANLSRSSNRTGKLPNSDNAYVGFRCVLPVAPEQ